MERRRWTTAARRIAAGLRELAHLATSVDEERFLLAVASGSLGSAARLADAIESENVEARVVVDGDGAAGVALPCRPDATDEEIRHVVLACVKAAHVGVGPPVALDVLAQVEALRAAEALAGQVGARVKSLGAGLRQAAGCVVRLRPRPAPGVAPDEAAEQAG